MKIGEFMEFFKESFFTCRYMRYMNSVCMCVCVCVCVCECVCLLRSIIDFAE